jgi:hypothetical protein
MIVVQVHQHEPGRAHCAVCVATDASSEGVASPRLRRLGRTTDRRDAGASSRPPRRGLPRLHN